LAAIGPEGALEHFFLDGHLAALDDYLRARPQAEKTLRAAASSGRLGLGPCKVLMDEHASSGETIVHNLQAGWEHASRLGEKPRVALLPPTWGHVAQLPQLMRQAGVDHVVVTAGPWPATAQGAFWWRSPDGSTVRAEYRAAYFPTGNAAAPGGRPGGDGPEHDMELSDEAERLLDSLATLEDGPGRRPRGPGTSLLWLHRADLSAPAGRGFRTRAESLAKLLQIVNAGQGKYLLRVTPAREYFDGAGSDGLPSITGELRPSPGGACPPGEEWDVSAGDWEGAFSGRLDLSAAVAAAEVSLERLAEPLCALWLDARQWPRHDLSSAWDQLVRAGGWRLASGAAGPVPLAPGIGAPGPAGALVYPYGLVADVAGSARQLALGNAARAFAGAATIVINPSCRARSGVVELPRATGTTAPTPALATGLPAGQPVGSGSLAWACAVPGYGWLSLPAATLAGDGPRGPGEVAPVQAWPAGVGDTSLDNGLVHLSVSSADGSFAVNGHWGLDRLIDDADDGNANGFRQPSRQAPGHPGGRQCRATPGGTVPVEVNIEVLEAGPLRGRIAIRRRYAWAHMADEVLTELELRAGETMARVTTSFFNQRPGHRLRTVFALPKRASHSMADCAFASLQRPTHPEASYPTKSFICAGGVVVAHEGLSEYSVTAGGWALALTLLRSTASENFAPWAASGDGPGGGAGAGHPGIAMGRAVSAWDRGSWLGPWARACPGPEQLGRHVVRYALAVGDPAKGPAGGLDPWQVAEDALVPLQVVQAPGGGRLPAQGAHLTVTGARVSALRRRGERLELRVFNPTAEPVLVEVPERRGELVDLQGNCLAYWEGSFALPPWSIATALIGPVPPPERAPEQERPAEVPAERRSSRY
jgi:hypothetical protein